MARITQQMVQDRLEELREAGIALDIEGAEYWQVENPYGPTGLHFLEVWPHEGRAVSQSTKLGTHHWSGPKEAHAHLTSMRNALWAARRAVESGDRHSAIAQLGNA